MIGIFRRAASFVGRKVAIWRGLHVLTYETDEPDTPESGVVHIIGEGGHSWFAVMRCPCGCGNPIRLSMVQESRPRWSFVKHWDDTVSLHPSVNRTVGCKSHFWLRNGRVFWC